MTKFFHPLPFSIFLNANVTMQNNIEGDEIGGGEGKGASSSLREGGSLII